MSSNQKDTDKLLNKQDKHNFIRNTITCLLLTSIILAIYLQSKDFEFINLDDPLYVTENPYVQQGLTQKSICAAFTTTTGDFWIPLTVLSLMADYEVYGMNAGGYHLTNMFFHILNTILLLFVLKLMTGSFFRSFFSASLFAVHPMFVESVMWISERKDVLSMFFFLLTLIFYSRYIRQKSNTGYFFIILFFILGLMSKPMLVTLPCAMLLLDYWPLNRLRPDRPGFMQTMTSLIIEKIPLFILSILFSILTFMTQNKGNAVIGLDDYSIAVRINNAVLSYVLYLKKFLAPVDLAVFYPHPLNTIPFPQIALSAVLLVIISFFAVRLSKKYPFFIVGWLWFTGILFPVIGFTQSGLQAMADRFIYIPSIGLIIVITWGMTEAVKDFKNKRKLLLTAALLSLSTLGTAAWIQAGYWENSIFLFKHTIAVTKNNHTAHTCLANAYSDRGINLPAVKHYAEALKIEPNHAKTHYNLGRVLVRENQPEAAIKHFKLSLKIRPEKPKAHNALAIELAKKNRLDSAIDHFKEAVRLDPGFIDAQSNLGFAFFLKGNYSEAIQLFQAILKKDPHHEAAKNNLEKAFKYKKINKIVPEDADTP